MRIAILTVLSFSLTLPALDCHCADEVKHPHIILLVADDMSWDEVGFHEGLADTPNIDRLASAGVRLNRFYVNPVCSPTRTALMTGRSPARFGITGPLLLDGGVPLTEHFMSESFQQSGYHTVLVGKWHLGASGEDYSPLNRGFDHFYGHRNGSIDYYTHTNRGKPDWQRDGKQLSEEGYSTDLMGKEAVAVIESNPADRSLFLFTSFNAPHGPAQAPEALIKKYTLPGRSKKKAAKMAAIEAMDGAIGKILNALDARAMTQRSLVMFFSDNGGKHKPGDSNPGSPPRLLRGGKSELFEGGIRVPAVIRYPGIITARTRCDHFISINDLFPTLAAAANIPILSRIPLDGKDRWPVIKGGKYPKPAPFVISGAKGAFAAFHDPLKLIRNGDGNEMLFDVITDPSEKSNLASNPPAGTTELRQFLTDFEEVVQLNDQPTQ